jgi:hypothetical protein
MRRWIVEFLYQRRETNQQVSSREEKKITGRKSTTMEEKREENFTSISIFAPPKDLLPEIAVEVNGIEL